MENTQKLVEVIKSLVLNSNMSVNEKDANLETIAQIENTSNELDENTDQTVNAENEVVTT